MLDFVNLTLKIPLILWSPYMEKCSIDEGTLIPTPTCPKPGYNNEILGEVLRILNISYNVYPLPNVTDMSFIDDNGDWQGHLGDVMRGVYDMSAGMYIVTSSRVDSFDFSYPLAFVKPAVFFQKGKPIIDSSNLVRVFNWKVWTTFLGFGVLISLASAFSVMVITKKPLHWTFNEIRGQLWLSWTFFTDQSHIGISDSRVKRSTAIYVLLVLLGIASLFFIGNYQGSLLSVLVQDIKLEAVTGADDLATKVSAGELTLIARKGSGFVELIQSSPLPVYGRLREAFKNNPIVFKEGNEFTIAEEAAADPSLVTVLTTQLNGIQNTQKICNSDYAELWDVPAQYSGFVFRKNDERTNFFQTRLNAELAHYTFIQHMFDKYKIANPQEIQRCVDSNQQMASLDLQSLRPLFYLVSIGGVTGMITIIIEIMRNRCTDKNMVSEIPLVQGTRYTKGDKVDVPSPKVTTDPSRDRNSISTDLGGQRRLQSDNKNRGRKFSIVQHGMY